MSLPTNEHIEQQILANDNLEELLGLQGAKGEGAGTSMHRVLYCLQIIKSLIYEYKQSHGGSVVVHLENAKAAAEAQEEVPLTAENYEMDFPSLSAMDEGAGSPGSNNRAGSTSPEQRSPTPERARESSNGEPEPQIDSHQGADDQGSPVRDSGAIPLPYAGPFLPGAQPQPNNYDVPVAPASRAAAIGAPNASNTQTHCKSVADFVGRRVTHTISSLPAGSDLLLEARREWLPNFLAGGGLQKLINLLKNLSHFHFTGGKAGSEAAAGAAQDQIAKKCLNEVMEALKVLLVSSFCANEGNQSLALELQRKMSSCSGSATRNAEMAD